MRSNDQAARARGLVVGIAVGISSFAGVLWTLG